MSWATTAEVLAITRITVTEDDLTAAQFLIEMFADTTEDSDALIYPKNLRLLKLAVAYQAAWMSEHPDVYVSMDLTSANQDGMSWTVNNPQAGVLAPLAKMAIARLSWRRNRSVYLRPGDTRTKKNYLPRTLNTTNAAADDYLTDWRPLD